jgi:hypothetical protein
MKMLNQQELEVLKSIFLKHCPPLLPILETLGQVALDDIQREAIRGALADELIESGLNDKDEPNKKGFLLEDLIDRLGHF